MSIRNKNKDHLKDHASVQLVAPVTALTSDDPLVFWTGHPTENTLVDLHEFADGATETSNPTGGGSWSGSFAGRPELIAELAPSIQARLLLAPKETCGHYLKALRKFWRTCDEFESIATHDGRTIDRLTSVRDLTHLHESAMHRAKFDRSQFGIVRNLLDDTRRLMRLGPLVWTAPKGGEPNRQLIPDAHAKALKIGIKRDWEKVRITWQHHDAIRRGEEPDTLNEYQKLDPQIIQEFAKHNEFLRRNWTHFERIQTVTGRRHPTTLELCEGKTPWALRKKGLLFAQMRAIAFPTMEEAHIAFHAALMRSGWNPSTLITGIDASQPNSIFQHPKDTKQSVLAVKDDQSAKEKADDNANLNEFNMQGSKRRAGGRMQFCMGLKKDPDSPPNIVAAYLERTKELRDQLQEEVWEAQATYERLKTDGASRAAIEGQFKRLQKLQQGTRNVWLYVDYKGCINWLDGKDWRSSYTTDSDAGNGKRRATYLELMTQRLNAQRGKHGEDPIAVVTPSDFRDIYARWVYLQSGGNILAVMIALGHSSLKSTNNYVTNNIFSTENDQAARDFYTHLFNELAIGRLDLTILAQLVRHGEITDEMHARLTEYRSLTQSRIKVACADVRHPPPSVDPQHVEGKRCGTHRCLMECPHARFLPESCAGVAMRVEELMVMSDHLTVDAWTKGDFAKEIEAGEFLLAEMFAQNEVERARLYWREKIRSGKHVVPSVGLVREQEFA